MTLRRDVQAKNAASSIFVIELGNMMFVSEVQSLKASLPILVTVYSVSFNIIFSGMEISPLYLSALFVTSAVFVFSSRL